VNKMNEKISLAELKNKAMDFDRAEMRELDILNGEERIRERKYMAVWNLDKKERACIAPKTYCVIQHREATESIIEALTSLNIRAEAKLKTSKHGVFIDLDFPDMKFELTQVGESFTSGLRLEMDYSKTAGLVLGARVTRLKCSNGMLISQIVRSHRVRFTEELKITLEGVIDRILKDIIASDEKLTAVVSECMKDSVEWTALRLLLKQMFRKKKLIREILTNLDGSKERISRFDLYNSVTRIATHGERIKPHIEIWLQNKANKILKHSFKELSEIEVPKKQLATTQ